MFEGKDSYAVKLVRKSGFELTEYFDVTSGLLNGFQLTTTSMMGKVPGTAVLDGYKTFDGLLVPTITRQKAMGIESVITFDSIRIRHSSRERVCGAAADRHAREVGVCESHDRYGRQSDRARSAPGESQLRRARSSIVRTAAWPRHARRVRIGSNDPDAKQDQLSPESLADLDLGVLHRAWSADVRPVRARLRLADGGVARPSSSSAPESRACAGKLPGVEPAPYIIRFTEDRPNPLYRRICYTFAWSAVVTFAVLNIAGLVWAIATGEWRLRQIYEAAYFPIAITMWVLGALGLAAAGQAIDQERRPRAPVFLRIGLGGHASRSLSLWLLWTMLPRGRSWDALKLTVFVGILVFVGNQARRGLLPRTRPIVPGELAISD